MLPGLDYVGRPSQNAAGAPLNQRAPIFFRVTLLFISYTIFHLSTVSPLKRQTLRTNPNRPIPTNPESGGHNPLLLQQPKPCWQLPRSHLAKSGAKSYKIRPHKRRYTIGEDGGGERPVTEMVKFSKDLEAQLIPEWKEAFVDYWLLKKHVKRIKFALLAASPSPASAHSCSFFHLLLRFRSHPHPSSHLRKVRFHCIPVDFRGRCTRKLWNDA